MKHRVLAASTLFGVASLVTVSFATVSFAQGDSQSMQMRSRMSVPDNSASVGRVSPGAPVGRLESARLPSGMMPDQPVGPVRGFVADMSDQPLRGGNIQQSLSRN